MLADLIVATTGIPRAYLEHGTVWSAPGALAPIMSWSARRLTTCTEDLAYSLLGIFDVNLPLLYGEGFRAFARLQQQILMQTEDFTLLAWGHDMALAD